MTQPKPDDDDCVDIDYDKDHRDKGRGSGNGMGKRSGFQERKYPHELVATEVRLPEPSKPSDEPDHEHQKTIQVTSNRDMVLPYLQCDVYNSPIPASFLRLWRTQYFQLLGFPHEPSLLTN